MAGPEARRRLRPGAPVRCGDLQDVGQGLPSPRRRWSHAPVPRSHPEDQPSGRHHHRPGSGQARSGLEADPPRRAVDGQARRGIRCPHGGLVGRACRNPFDDRTRSLRDGGAGPVHGRLERDVAAQPSLPGPGPRKHQHAVLDQGRIPGEHGGRRCRLRGPPDGRGPGGRRTRERTGPVDHPALRSCLRRGPRRSGRRSPRRDLGPPGAGSRNRLRSGAHRRPHGALHERRGRTRDEDPARLRRAVLAGRRLQRPERRTPFGGRGHPGRLTGVRAPRCHGVVHLRTGGRTPAGPR